jgi:hypothetical protein
MGGLALLLALASCSKLAENIGKRAAKREAPLSEPLDQRYSSPNGLITIHYPADFAAKVVGKSSLVLERNLPDDQVELVTFVSTDKPVSDDVAEFARVINVAEAKALTNYTEKTNQRAECNGAPGVQVEGEWQPEPGAGNFRKSCAFLRDGHGFSFAYSVPDSYLSTHRALLESIVAATAFN